MSGVFKFCKTDSEFEYSDNSLMATGVPNQKLKGKMEREKRVQNVSLLMNF